MVTNIRCRDFSLYYKDNDDEYKEIFDEILAYNFKTVEISHNTDNTKVSLIDVKYSRYIFKVLAPKTKRNERFLRSFVKGDYHRNLIVKTDRVRSAGLAFPNDFYFLAERKIFNYASVFIVFIEHVEGAELNDMPIIPEDVKAEIRALMEESYASDMLSGNLHQGNFIVSKDSVRIIDLSGKSCTAKRKVRDRLAVERRLGIANEIENYSYYSVVYGTKLRKFTRKLKGKA